MKFAKIAWIAPLFSFPLIDVGLDAVFSLQHHKEPEVIGLESELAYGNPISLKKASLIDLEIIPGVASETAEQIMMSRDAIYKDKSFEPAKGVGEKRNKSLKRYIKLD